MFNINKKSRLKVWRLKRLVLYIIELIISKKKDSVKFIGVFLEGVGCTQFLIKSVINVDITIFD